MAKAKGAIVVDTVKCKGCELCMVACPTKVIEMAREVNAKGFHYSQMGNPEACIGCTNCAMVCPDSCITVYKVKA
ncbi:4Fe-4S dicluster domain-containing protein [Labilibacter sediminis]|nr:4Fe-4S dicluster domain-containing protein [Labilibacter sediminis]